jgi:hypothetical protein
MDEMTQHNAALVEETNTSIERTEKQAVELDRIVDIFHIDDEASSHLRVIERKHARTCLQVHTFIRLIIWHAEAETNFNIMMAQPAIAGGFNRRAWRSLMISGFVFQFLVRSILRLRSCEIVEVAPRADWPRYPFLLTGPV